jgi:hypothetical protein
MNDFVLMLTATLHLSPTNIHNSIHSEQTLIDDNDSQNRLLSSSERTIVGPLHETNRLYQRCQSIRQ